MTTTQTQQPVPRGTRPDGIKSNKLYLMKKVRVLRATYQIRLLAFFAVTDGTKLVLMVPSVCKFHPSLLALIEKTGTTIVREDL